MKHRRLAVLNEKGGSGKTTTAVNLAAGLASTGNRVLLLDLDPQCSATACVGLTKLIGTKGTFGTAEFVLGGPDVPFEPQRGVLGLSGLDVVPGQKETLPFLEMNLLKNQMSGNIKLRSALDRVERSKDVYDWVIVDCSPALGLLAINAVNACRDVLVPVELGGLANMGAVSLRSFVDVMRNEMDSRIRIAGVLGTLYDQREKDRRQALEFLQQYFGALCFNTVVDRAAAISAANTAGRPIVLSDPNHRGAKQYMSVMTEVIARG
ncbi:ParA family protein (plasmid) [Myxococcus sp. MxC21-1]|uniref:ParA family protein n=1 Tax=Myxococcus sp. MxC21-1 TaxID=3041439 RepID=UPI0029314A45|nr:ParA family protein [Myxococcus sp. MxC21-1]WNZ66237.1 ParA family protein [Myxococcus sp. MxC21-1]